MTIKNYEDLINKIVLWKNTSHKTKQDFIKSLNKEYILIKRDDVENVNATSKEGVQFDDF
jgi:hypothetical protein